MHPERAARLLAILGTLLLLAVLSVRGLSLAAASQRGAGGAVGLVEPQPVQGRYIFSNDGRQVTFELGLAPPGVEGQEVNPSTAAWYRMALEGGPITPAEPPEEDIRPFLLRSDQLFLLVGDGFSLTTGSLPDTSVVSTALSPDGEAMAFAAIHPGGRWGLYVLYSSGQLNWLGEEERITDLAWSPDGERLAFVAPREGQDQVFVIDRSGAELRQLTGDPTQKSSPVWLDDNQTIAFIAAQFPPPDPDEPPPSGQGPVSAATPTPGPANWPPEEPALSDATTDIYTIELDGQNLRRLTETPLNEYRLIPVLGGQQIAFTARPCDWPCTATLYVMDPRSGEQRRVYPPYSIDVLECPKNLALGKPSQVRLKLSNSSLLPAGIPIILRAGPRQLPLLGERRSGAVRVETVDLNPGETRQVEWPVENAPGLETHLSVLIDLGKHFPMAEQHCVIPNTYLGLPNLPFLPLTLPLTAAGLVFCIPWLRQQQKKRYWIAWFLSAVLVVGLVWLEVTLIA